MTARADILVHSGDSIDFLGDSITAQGAVHPSGYINLVITGLAANGIKATAIPEGISGQTSKDMLARFVRDVVDKKPTWLTISCGVNDVWHGAQGVPLDQYKINITSMVDQAQAAGIKVVLLTSTMIYEKQDGVLNQKLVDYNTWLRSLATEKNIPLADLNADMQAKVTAILAVGGPAAANRNNLTIDGVHMNPLGNEMMATGILRAMGLSPDQLTTAHNAWLDIPASTPIEATTYVTLRQYEDLTNLAVQQHMGTTDLINKMWTAEVATPNRPDAAPATK